MIIKIYLLQIEAIRVAYELLEADVIEKRTATHNNIAEFEETTVEGELDKLKKYMKKFRTEVDQRHEVAFHVSLYPF